jgi:hypothetical protein
VEEIKKTLCEKDFEEFFWKELRKKLCGKDFEEFF